jgi:hypothetical protein
MLTRYHSPRSAEHDRRKSRSLVPNTFDCGYVGLPRLRGLGPVEKAAVSGRTLGWAIGGLLPDVDDPLMAAMRLGTRAGVVAIASGAAVAPLWALPPQPATAIAALMHATALSLALGFMIRSARSGDAAMRRTRCFLAAALGAGALDAVLSVGYVAVAGSIPVPSVVDVGLAWGPLAAWRTSSSASPATRRCHRRRRCGRRRAGPTAPARR